MKRAVIIVLCACGPSPPPAEPMPASVGRPISVEWRATQGDGDIVNVAIVVDGKTTELGVLNAATELEAGTPNTCALRSAHPLRTEFLCGELSAFFAAELEPGELVISYVEGHQWREMRRIPVFGEGLAVRPYALPTGP